jgi:hypothetical protein
MVRLKEHVRHHQFFFHSSQHVTRAATPQAAKMSHSRKNQLCSIISHIQVWGAQLLHCNLLLYAKGRDVSQINKVRFTPRETVIN